MLKLTRQNRTVYGDMAVTSGRNILRKRIWYYRSAYLFLLPAVVWYVVFHYIPIYGLILGFKDFSFSKGILGSPWIGFRYFEDFLTDVEFYKVVRNTLTISISKLAFGFPAPIILALMLNEVRNGRFKKIIQTVSYLPHFISWVVVVTLMSKFLSPTSGLINEILINIGYEPVYFMGKKSLFLPLVIMSDIWKNIGWGSIIYLAALTNIDPSLYEAATIDGAGRWKSLVHITLPGLKPTIGILFIMSLAGVFNAGFDQLYLMQNPSVADVAEVLDTYVLRRGLLNGQFGYSTAVGLFQSIITLILIVSVNAASKKLTEVSLW